MNITRLLFTAVMAAVTAIPVSAQNSLSFSYNTGSSELAKWGTLKKENYDVAIRIDDANLVGKQIKSVTVPFDSADDLSGFKVWLSKELTLETVDGVKQNAPDIASVDAVVESNLLIATFAEPYTIPEGGLYVGYSFTVDKLTDMTSYPVVVSPESNPNGLFLHTSRTYRSWEPKSESFGAVSAMTVMISGDFYENSVGIAAFSEQYAEAGKAGEATLTLVQNGSSMVNSIDYTYEVAGLTGEGHYDFTESIPAQYSKKQDITLPVPAVAEVGGYPLTYTITRVNGVDNVNAAASATATLNVMPFVPVHRPLLEEYTGMWCGYCPRGFVGLELMNEKYPDLFVGVSYHNGDILEIMSSTEFPSDVPGFPDAWLDRVHETDAYHGDDYSGYGFALDDVYLARSAEIAPASVDVTAEWADDAQQTINVTGTVTFIKDVTGVDYRLAYILVADGLHGEGEKWGQSNYFSGNTDYAESEGMDVFVNGGSTVYGLYYNDVAVLTSDIKGIAGSLPSDFKTAAPETCTYQFNVADAVNTSGENIIQDKSKLRVVAVLVDAATGEVLNSNKCNVGGQGGTGIAATLGQKGEIESVEYFDASGRRVSSPSNGLYIKSVKYSDGSVRTSKVVLK